ncbi:hypothetical protein [Streptomyces sp. XM4193]|uniref:hypothetical protein n=1 Tax=Streptomyces sp. XM4193 TaxID=2929782 RepID=UPI001FFA7116|nr:hypothetical protein [Streptomyces sp. XM4193]
MSTAQRTFRIRANTKPDGSGRYLEGTIAHAHKRVSVHYRDEVWARYRTDVASGDAIMALSRGELEERSGGWSRSPEPLLLALVPAGVAGARWWWVRTRRSDRAGRGPVAAAVHNGRARALRVRVSGHRKSAFNKGRVLVLTSLRGGERELLLERWVDTDRVAETLSGCEGWLYWEPRAVRGPSPSSVGVQHGDAPRSLGPRMRDSGRPALDSAVFVLADGSALRGRTPSVPSESMPEGERVPRLPAERCPQVRPLDGRVLRRPRLRLTALLAGLPGAAVLLAMLVVPLGDPEQVWSMRLMLLAAAVLIPCFVHNRLAGRAWARR